MGTGTTQTMKTNQMAEQVKVNSAYESSGKNKRQWCHRNLPWMENLNIFRTKNSR